MKEHYNALSSTPTLSPTTGIRITSTDRPQLSQHAQHQWEGSRLDALSSKKLWLILLQLTHNSKTIDPEVEAAIKAELIARGDHASAARWRAPH